MVQTRNHRYIRYDNGEEELYDHRADPDELENLALREESRDIMVKLAKWLPASEIDPVPNVPAKKKNRKN